MVDLLPFSPGEPEIRELTLKEIQSLAPQFEATGNSLPSPGSSTFIGILIDGVIKGFQCLQLKIHAQPTQIDEGYSHLFSALCRKSEEVILAKSGPQWVYVFTSPGRMAALAESRGMTIEPWCVLSKLVQPSLPEKGVFEFLPSPVPLPESEEVH